MITGTKKILGGIFLCLFFFQASCALEFPEGRYSGRGIVVCAGGEKFLTNAWINLHFLRDSGCQLPVEIWHIGEEEINQEWMELFSSLRVTFHDVTEYFDFPISGWVCKPCALVASSFEEVLLLDADNIPLKDPTFLFKEPSYCAVGALFWPDVMWVGKNNPIWKYLNLSSRDMVGQESGQLLVDKKRSWEALQVVVLLNQNSKEVYRWVYGDKDTYILSWLSVGQPCHMVKYFPGFLKKSNKTNVMMKNNICCLLQRDLQGNPLFLHLSNNEWELSEKFFWKGNILEIPVKPYQYLGSSNQKVHFHNGKLCSKATDSVIGNFHDCFPEVKRRGLALLESLREIHKQIVNAK